MSAATLDRAVDDRSGCPAKRHGTYVAYQGYGCRCDDAREDYRIYQKRWRQGRALPRLHDGTGVLRRIRALMRAGHNAAAIAAAAGDGWTDEDVRKLLQTVAQGARVTGRSLERTRRAYTALADTPGTSKLTRLYAERAGWPRPIDWDDDTIDDPEAEPAVDPDDPGDQVDEVAVDQVIAWKRRWGQLNPAERRHAVDQLRAAGATDTKICRVLRISKTTLEQVGSS